MAAISCLLLSLLLVTVTPLPGSAEDTGSLLLQCYDPAPTNGTAFRASLLRLLAALPSAAAPTGFASLTYSAGAFARGLCYGDSTTEECRRCLAVAARNLASGCGAATRRAGIWSEGCFLAYAYTDASSPRENAFRSRLLLRGHHAVPGPVRSADADAKYDLHAELVAEAQLAAWSAAANISGARMLATADSTNNPGWAVTSTVHVLAQCARDRTATQCVRCLEDSARAVDWELDADRDGGVAAAVVGFNCYLAFEVTIGPQPQDYLGSNNNNRLNVAMIFGGAAAFLAYALCDVYCDCDALFYEEEQTNNEEEMDAAAAGADKK